MDVALLPLDRIGAEQAPEGLKSLALVAREVVLDPFISFFISQDIMFSHPYSFIYCTAPLKQFPQVSYTPSCKARSELYWFRQTTILTPTPYSCDRAREKFADLVLIYKGIIG